MDTRETPKSLLVLVLIVGCTIGILFTTSMQTYDSPEKRPLDRYCGFLEQDYEYAIGLEDSLKYIDGELRVTCKPEGSELPRKTFTIHDERQ